MTIQEIYEYLKTKLPNAELVFDDIKPDGAIHVKAEHLLGLANFLRDNDKLKFDSLMCLSGIDIANQLATIYHLHSMTLFHKLTLVCGDTKDQEVHIPSVAGIWATANFHEREAYDMYGIIYDGHPDFRRILCPDDWEGYPLRKDYVPQTSWHGIPLTTIIPKVPEAQGETA